MRTAAVLFVDVFGFAVQVLPELQAVLSELDHARPGLVADTLDMTGGPTEAASH